jgi:hypothetical protein
VEEGGGRGGGGGQGLCGRWCVAAAMATELRFRVVSGDRSPPMIEEVMGGSVAVWRGGGGAVSTTDDGRAVDRAGGGKGRAHGEKENGWTVRRTGGQR